MQMAPFLMLHYFLPLLLFHIVSPEYVIYLIDPFVHWAAPKFSVLALLHPFSFDTLKAFIFKFEALESVVRKVQSELCSSLNDEFRDCLLLLGL